MSNNYDNTDRKAIEDHASKGGRFRIDFDSCLGVAWRFKGPDVTREYEEYNDGGDMHCVDAWENEDRGIFIMVGDDREFSFDYEDVIPIEDDEYCGQCGQIGCGHG